MSWSTYARGYRLKRKEIMVPGSTWTHLGGPRQVELRCALVTELREALDMAIDENFAGRLDPAEWRKLFSPTSLVTPIAR
jgi:hypothetical protein